ncbi:hypothetical protein [Kineococcus sp. SYSU DK006]|uniref:hypothetical protein n=1 Tax=Kineococcus sp. SYSU DK006 TaxID=3383127 RepID=UPI003D7EBCB9
MSDAWPIDGYLLHPGFGLVRYQQQPLPLEERDLPTSWQVLDNSVQDERLEQTWRLVLAWAQRRRVDRVEGEFIRLGWPVAAAAGLSQQLGSPYRWSGAFSAAALEELLAANPERLWVVAGGELVVYLHETWDSLIVRGGEGVLEELRRGVAALHAEWS